MVPILYNMAFSKRLTGQAEDFGGRLLSLPNVLRISADLYMPNWSVQRRGQHRHNKFTGGGRGGGGGEKTKQTEKFQNQNVPFQRCVNQHYLGITWCTVVR